MGGAIDKQTMLGLIIDAKRTDSYPFRALFIGNSWFNGWDPVEVTHWMPLPAPPNRRPSEVAP